MRVFKKIKSIQLTVIIILLSAPQAFPAFYLVNQGAVNTFTNIVKSGANNALTQTSNQGYFLTGSSTETITLPDATSLPQDWYYTFVNTSAGAVTINSYGGSTIGTVLPATQSIFLLRTKSTGAGTWYQISNSTSGSSAAISFSDFSATSPLVYDGAGGYSIPQADGSTNGYLSAADWITFNNSASGNFITDLTGDVTATGPDSAAATVAFVGGETAADVATSVQDTQAATDANTANTIVKRDASGDFSAGIITADLVGNADTATELAATPTACDPGDFATGIDANGDAICDTPAAAGIDELTGDVTAGPGTGAQAATIAANAVTNGKFRQSAGLSVVGRSANSTGDVADITAANDGEVLRRNGTSIGFGDITFGALPQITSYEVYGNPTGSTADAQSSSITSLLDGAFSSTQGSVLYRGASAWLALAPGTDGQVLTTGGAGANPAWETAGGGGGEFVGSLSYAGTTNCVWTRTSNASFADYSADTDCASPTVTGNVSAPGTKVPAVVFTADDTSYYCFIAIGKFGGTAANPSVSFRFSDGTNSTPPGSFSIATASGDSFNMTINGCMQFSSSGSKTVHIQGTGAQASQDVRIDALTGTTTALTINVLKFPVEP